MFILIKIITKTVIYHEQNNYWNYELGKVGEKFFNKGNVR